MTTVTNAIDKILSSADKKPTVREARKSLRACGVLNNRNGINPAYKGIVVHKKNGNN